MLDLLVQQLIEKNLLEHKNELLRNRPEVVNFLARFSHVASFIGQIPELQQYIVYSIIVAGQGERLLFSTDRPQVEVLLKQLSHVEKFYSSIGGILGYHVHMLKLLESKDREPSQQELCYLPPDPIPITDLSLEVKEAILAGLEGMPLVAEIYPLGGAADRLRLYDETSGQPLPAARLPFLGKTLLEGLITDLQSREYLYYKLYGSQVTTPVALMTSHDKNNHQHILEIFEEADWFGRPKNSFKLFCQPLVPTMNKQGHWCLQGPQQLLLKPGGHGVLWRLAKEEGVFDWFKSQGRTKMVVRQVNNPIANTDYGLLAFVGMGLKGNKRFGFASCARKIKAQEGMNILVEKKDETGFKYSLTNIEYCDFKKFGISDTPEKPGSSYSRFPSNTNILFADIEAVSRAVDRCPIPGILVNMKKISYTASDGTKKEEEAARLESTMQNIADLFEEHQNSPLRDMKDLQTFLTYNHRCKTISAVKREFTLGSSLMETPEGCFLDILHNARDLLTNHCHIDVPELSDPLEFFKQGPSFIVLYHPALGPCYTLISKKWRYGRLHTGAEVQLQISEIDFEHLNVNGSLLVIAENVTGHLNNEGQRIYSEFVGRCVLKNVTIVNKGIDHDFPNVYWKNEIARQESCQIILRGMSEFYAENVTLAGDQFIEVPHGFRCLAFEKGGKVEFIFDKIESPSWSWQYSFTHDYAIEVKNFSHLKSQNL